MYGKCSIPSTRHALHRAYSSRCKEANTAILEKVLKLRTDKAKLLNYPSHASYVLEKQMSKTPERVQEFLRDLAREIAPVTRKEKVVMLQYKEDECKRLNLPYDGLINAWDRLYYTNKVIEHQYNVDHDELQQYFPIDVVTKGLFHIYQEVLGITLLEVEEKNLWHEDVKMFEVTDTESRSLLGHFYMDMHPRDGKYTHACCRPLQRGCLRADGTRNLPSCCLVCNFTKPAEDKPALLTHHEVIVFFHEFGHAMHNIFAKTETSLFSNTNVEEDFLEAPSQMLENWCWNFETLSLMSCHYKTKQIIPKEKVDQLEASRRANGGHFIMRQVVLSLFDQDIHTMEQVDTAKHFSSLFEEFLDIKLEDGINMAASFLHVMKLYDARYYGYIWSMRFSMDMYRTRFEREGLLNKQTGSDYKNFILKPGGSVDGSVMLFNFLEREPNSEAFMDILGLIDN